MAGCTHIEDACMHAHREEKKDISMQDVFKMQNEYARKSLRGSVEWQVYLPGELSQRARCQQMRQ